MIQLYNDDKAVSIEDYPLSRKPFEENGEFILEARGSGQRSTLKTDYEEWCYGFLVEIETNDGKSFYSWTKAKQQDSNLIATFTLKNSQPIASG